MNFHSDKKGTCKSKICSTRVKESVRDTTKTKMISIIFFSFLLIFGLGLELALPITQASATTTVSIGNFTSASGETVTAPILIGDVQNYGTGTISITYHPAVVHVTGVANGPASTVVASNINNDKGTVTVSAWNLGGVSGDVIFANVTFKAVGRGSTPLNISTTTLKDTTPSPISAIPINGSFTVVAQLTPFFTFGYVFYENGSACNGPVVSITNLNTGNNWSANTHANHNYYQLILTNGTDVNSTDTLQFEVTSHDGSQANITEHEVTQENITDGGLFNFNINMSECPQPDKPDLVITDEWVCWPNNCTICYNVTNIGNGTASAGHNTTLYVDGLETAQDKVPVELAPNASYIGCFNYTWIYTPPDDNITVCADKNETVTESDEGNNCLTNTWKCGDVDGNGYITMADVGLLWPHVFHPVEYPINEWTGDVDGNGHITMADVGLLWPHKYYPDLYPLKCRCSYK